MAGSPILAAADAVTILEQIDGAVAYLDTVGARANDLTYKRMRLALEGAHRALHNRMRQGPGISTRTRRRPITQGIADSGEAGGSAAARR